MLAMESSGKGKADCAEHWSEQLQKLVAPETVVRRSEPLAKRTTLRVGGPADLYVEPASEQDLSTVLRYCSETGMPVFVLGRGSNLLIRDGGIRGLVICLGNAVFSRVEVEGVHLRCGAGARLKAIAVEARRHGIAGLEFLEGIPGSLGGGLRMNAGAMGSWTFAVVETVRSMDMQGKVRESTVGELDVSYRNCAWFRSHVALGAVLRGQQSSADTVGEVMKRYSQKRWESQPSQPSAGCIFKNPKTIPAGKLIDELGLKGASVGAASVSDVHGNFIVNRGGATAREVLELIELIRARARETRGIELETEVEIIGE